MIHLVAAFLKISPNLFLSLLYFRTGTRTSTEEQSCCDPSQTLLAANPLFKRAPQNSLRVLVQYKYCPL